MDKVVKSLLKLSEEELLSAQNEYKKGIYHKSLFLFQQSIEKAYKALALETRQIGLPDLKDAGHDYIKLLKKSLRNLPNETIKKVFENNQEIFDDTDPIDEDEILKDIMRSGRSDFLNLSEEDIVLAP